MNSSKLRGPVVPLPFPLAWADPLACPSGAVLSAMPSPQQSVTAPDLQAAPSAGLPLPLDRCPATGVGAAFLAGPKRASIAPRMHSLMTVGGRPYRAPWNG